MIQTTNPVPVPTKDNRGIEQKIVYAVIETVKIIKGKYLLEIKEFVIDEIEEAGDPDPIIYEVNRTLATVKRTRTKDELRQLIALLKDEATLTALGLQEHIGVYESKDQLDQNDYVAEVGHLITNNQDQIRGVQWVLSS